MEVTREQIKAEIENVGEEHLAALYHIIKGLESPQNSRSKQSLLSKLKQVKIQGPEDFAQNIDHYLNEEKRC